MKNYLVPCDFSPPAINAFRFALRMAIQSKANVHLLHAIQLPVLNNPLSSLVIGLENRYIEELKANFQRQFESHQEKYLLLPPKQFLITLHLSQLTSLLWVLMALAAYAKFLLDQTRKR